MYRRKANFIGSLLLAVIALSIFPALSAAQTGPCLDVSHDSLIFHGDLCDGVIAPNEADSLSFAVMNCGTDSLVWFTSGYQPWIGFTPTSGVDFDSVYVWIDWNQIPIPPDTLLPGDSVYLSGIIWVTAPDASPDTLKAVNVGLWVACSDAGPQRIITEPDHFSFTLDQGVSISDNFSITEVHGDTVMIDVVSFANWLTVPQFFAPIYTPSVIELGVHTSGLNLGSYTGVILVTAYDSTTGIPLDTATVTVALTVIDSSLFSIQASPEVFTYHLNMGDSVIGESLFVSEAGGASINFWTYNQDNWLFVDTFDASPLYTPETITFDIHTDGLAEGFYSDSIYIWGEGAGPDPFYIAIRIFVTDTTTPVVVTQPTSLNFVLQQGTFGMAADSLNVYEASGRSVSFYFTHQAWWLAVNPLGIGPYFTPTSLLVVAVPDSLPPGIYYDTIRIMPDTGAGVYYDTVVVPVTFEVTPAAPQIVAMPSNVNITSDVDLTTSSYVVAFDAFGGNYDFAVEADPGNSWLQIQSGSGTTPDSIYFSISTAGLAYGAYSDTLVIYNPLDAPSPYFERRVPINLYVSPDTGYSYVLNAEPASLHWRFPQHTGAANYVHLFEQYGRSGPFHYGWSAPWLEAWVFTQNGPVFTFPCSLFVYSIDSMMTPGYYHDTLWLWPDTDGVSFAPVAIPITLEALPDEPIMAFPNHFEFTANSGDSIIGNSFVVHSPGTTNLTYDIFLKNSSSWLEWVYPSGQLTVLPTTLDTIAFDILAGGMAPGIYVDTFVIFNPLDSASGYFEITVPITMTIGTTSASAICGDVNNDGIGPDISDLTYLVAFMFINGPPPPMIDQVKFTGASQIDITNLTAMVDYMFRFGPPLNCPFD